MKGNKQFNVKGNVVYCTMKYNDTYFVGKSVKSVEDAQDDEYGKAVAYARADLLLREKIKADASVMLGACRMAGNGTPVGQRIIRVAEREYRDAVWFCNRQRKMLNKLIFYVKSGSHSYYREYLREAQQLAAGFAHA